MSTRIVVCFFVAGREHLVRVLEQVGQDRKEAARLLDISLSSLYRKIEEFDIA